MRKKELLTKEEVMLQLLLLMGPPPPTPLHGRSSYVTEYYANWAKHRAQLCYDNNVEQLAFQTYVRWVNEQKRRVYSGAVEQGAAEDAQT